MAKLKKLKLKDINRNSAIEKKYTINKIKRQELKYTIFLVVFFMLTFCFIGYKLLFINQDDLVLNENNNSIKSLGFASSTVLLTKEDIFNDKDFLKSKNYLLQIDNYNRNDIEYQVLFREDYDAIKKCGCINSNNIIKYSIDNKTTNFLDNNKVIFKGKIKSNSSNEILVRVWFSKENKINDELHFHGEFELEQIKG